MSWKSTDLSPWWWNLGLDDNFRVTSSKSPAYIMECDRFERLGQTMVTITGKGDFLRVEIDDSPDHKEVFGAVRQMLEFCKELQKRFSEEDKNISKWFDETLKGFPFTISGWIKLVVAAPDLVGGRLTFEVNLERKSGLTLKLLIDESKTHHNYCGVIEIEEGMSIGDAVDPFIEQIAKDQKQVVTWYEEAMNGFRL